VPVRGSISSKREFYKLWKQNVLGNRPLVFSTPEEAIASGTKLVGIRQVGVPGGRFDLVPISRLYSVLVEWKREGRIFSLDGGSDPTRVIFQGEVARTTRGFEGYFALFPRMAMRPAMARGLLTPYRGLKVVLLMKYFMDSNSYEDIRELMDMYPDSVIEFAVFDCEVGILPRRNTIVWEVRNY